MNFQQLRSVREATRQDFNLTAVALDLNTSQPGVSRQLRELEDELGIEIFQRAGEDFANLGRGSLTVGRHAFPGPLRAAARGARLQRAAPGCQPAHAPGHASPDCRAEVLLSGEADIGVATETLASAKGRPVTERRDMGQRLASG